MVVKEDRRVVRTRTNLKSAMLKLLSEKDFKEISITEISKVANCNRVTFYSHYKDSSHLLEDIFQDYLEQLAQYFRDSFKGKKASYYLTQHVMFPSSNTYKKINSSSPLC